MARTDIKAKIAKVAWRLFREKGYDAATVDEIIVKAGTSKGTFYHYYSGKDALLGTLPEVFDDKYREVGPTLDPDQNSYDKLIALSCIVHKMIQDEIPASLLANLYASQVVTRGDKHLLNRDRYYFRLVSRLIGEGQEKGELRKDISTEEMVSYYALCERAIVYDYCIAGASYDLEAHTRYLLPLLFSSMKAGNDGES